MALQAPGSGRLHRLAQEVAALTHGARAGHLPAADAVVFLAEALRTGDVRAATEHGLETIGASVEGPTYLPHYEDAIHAGVSAARSGAHADRLQRARTAMPTLCDALYVVTAFPEPDRIFEALRVAADHSTAGTAAVVGAVLGACHGPDALPTAAVSRLELGWVADVLAQDFVRESVERPRQPVPPGVVQFEDTPDPDWWARYPGW